MRKIVIFSLVCIVANVGFAIWAWQQLPLMESYPVHWSADGSPDRYGSKGEVLFNLSLMPGTSVFIFLLFYFVPKAEPIQTSIEPNSRPYTVLWTMMMGLFLGIQFFICRSYFDLQPGEGTPIVSVNYLAAGLSIFFLLIGNIMSKLRRNFLFGIKTPWTLTSDLSWDKTHRIAGRMMVISGLIGLLIAFILPAQAALICVVGMSLATTIFALPYSFIIWKSDPDKRT